MNVRPAYSLPIEKQRQMRKAIHLEWTTLFLLLTIIIVMYLAMGNSQAMKTAWIEDLLSLVPPIAFLVAARFRDRAPNQRFPYGFTRAPTLAFLAAAVAILTLGLYLVYDSVSALLSQHHPTFGHFSLFGSPWEIWSGWVMIGALIYSIIPMVIVGRLKLPLSRELHEKTLHAGAIMNKDDWLTAAAAILGILGVGLGFWWADSTAAGFIGLGVIKDGLVNIRRATTTLLDHRPMETATRETLGLAERLQEKLHSYPELRDADVRLREEGHLVSGEIFIVPRNDCPPLDRLEDIRRDMVALDWRLYDLVITPVNTLSH